MELAQDLLYIGIQGGATYNQAVHLTTECIDYLGADLSADDTVDAGDSHQYLHHRLLHYRLYLLLDYLLNYQRNGDYQSRLLLGECIEQDLG